MTAITFQFEALGKNGAKQKGVTQAVSKDAAFAQIASSGLTPVSIREVKARRSLLSGQRKIGLRELSIFTYQFSVLIEARIPISEGLRSIAEEESNERFRTVIEQVAASISAGSTITEAMEPFHDLFGDVYIQSLNAAEQSGNLVKVLNHLAEMLDREVEIRSQIRSALLYPLSVITILGLAVVFLLMFVVPRFATMFESRGIELPLPTRILLGTSHFLTHGWWFLLPGLLQIGRASCRERV